METNMPLITDGPSSSTLAGDELNTETEDKHDVDLSRFSGLVSFFEDYTKDFKEETPIKAPQEIVAHIKKIISDSSLDSTYNVIFLLHGQSEDISNSTLDSIYLALSTADKNKDLLLILNSWGGSIEPAYLISKCCKELPKSFAVAIPRKAKSAATLISLGADSIHMGAISELGPIDPQIRGLPALALGESLKYLASIAEQYPKSQEMFAKYLSDKLNLQTLGYMNRIPESARDYAARLLNGKELPKPPADIADIFVTGYKNHSFVIDKDEAKELLGGVIKTNTKEYELADQIYKFLNKVQLALWAAREKEYVLDFIGDVEDLWLSPDKA